MKEGDDFPFYDFPKPWVDETDKRIKPGFKIFFDHTFTEYDDPFFPTSKPVVPWDWVATMDGKAMSALLVEKEKENMKEQPAGKLVDEDIGSNSKKTNKPELE